MKPPDLAVARAVDAARRSPCAKSKRGVAIFDVVSFKMEPSAFPPRAVTSTVVGVGWNSQPNVWSYLCTGTEACRASCAQTCVHAEVRAIRDAIAYTSEAKLAGYSAVHVKIDEAGALVAGSGPSCWQCAREVADVELDWFWLFEDIDGKGPEAVNGTWKPYTASEFLHASLEACGISR